MGKMIWPLALCLAMASAWADDDEHHERHDKRRPRQLSSAGAPAVWKTECGSCHMAYPAGLLPAAASSNQHTAPPCARPQIPQQSVRALHDPCYRAAPATAPAVAANAAHPQGWSG